MKRKSILKKLIGRGEMGTILPIIALAVIATVLNSNFLQMNNFLDIMRTTSYTFCVAIAVTFLMTSAELDLSIGAAISMGSVVVAKCMTELGLPIPLSVAVALLCGVLFGMFNGILIIYFGLPSLITTLGTQYVLNGILAVVTNNYPITNIPESFLALGQGRLFEVLPYTIIIVIILGIIGQWVLSYTKYGRKVAAVGGNRETAYISGINVDRIRMSTYVLTSLFAVFAGIMMCSRFSSGQPTAGSGREMTIMAAVIIGGTSMFGGVGTVVGSFLGCLLFALITNVLVFMGVSTMWQNVIFGFILILSLLLDNYRVKINAKM